MLHFRLTDRDIERVLAGHQPTGRTDLAELTQLIAQIRTVSSAEQAPPMSPRLLAELDATELQRRSDGRGRPHRRAHIARRRWRLVGAAAVIVMLGGLAVTGLGGAGDRSQTEIGDMGSTGSSTTRSSSGSTETKTTEASTTTAAPVPTSQPSSASPATIGTELEPEPPPDDHDGERGGPPDGRDGDSHEERLEECLRQNPPDYECWIVIYQETQGAPPGTASSPP